MSRFIISRDTSIEILKISKQLLGMGPNHLFRALKTSCFLARPSACRLHVFAPQARSNTLKTSALPSSVASQSCGPPSYRNQSTLAYSQDIDSSKLIVRPTQSPKIKLAASELVFGKTFTDHMLVVKWLDGKGWTSPEIKPYGNLEIDPSAGVLHYATCLFEGMKAYKSRDGTIRLFRPEANMQRMNQSAQRLAFPNFHGDTLIELIKKLVKLDGDWIPAEPGYSLYIRPFMIGTGPGLGVGPSKELTLSVICCPVGPYYPNAFKPVSLLASSKYCRAWPGGSGSWKLGANYATGLLPQKEAAQGGYQQILWLFGEQDYLTEVGTMNLFVAVQDKSGIELVTPPLDDKILPGVTRDSILSLLRTHLDGSQKLHELPPSFKVSERPITMSEIVDRSKEGNVTEVFGAGTAAIVSSVDRINYKGKDIKIPVRSNGLGMFADAMQREILARQTGEIESKWSLII
ncbi:hypothetical protein O181_007050 [Austropuccinia psidii MF-1]|uniref:Branched-chain-amino-acid aminotransferase n=1 Tax=Austropuccinia psidii MF-1 TaxID=1389203 RepID=A0A9Q3GHG8_9BASI|nr:hypothetical protein [Austropuccinia psidii MF-1]